VDEEHAVVETRPITLADEPARLAIRQERQDMDASIERTDSAVAVAAIPIAQ
jgi:hypothetical protein